MLEILGFHAVVNASQHDRDLHPLKSSAAQPEIGMVGMEYDGIKFHAVLRITRRCSMPFGVNDTEYGWIEDRIPIPGGLAPV